VNKPCQYRLLGINRPPVEVTTKCMVYSLGRYLYWWFISPQLSTDIVYSLGRYLYWWFITTSRGNDQVNKPCQYKQLGTNRPPVEVTTKCGRYLYWWSISSQLSVLTWFIHLVVTSAGGLLVPSE
jgi:hypothetical protein